MRELVFLKMYKSYLLIIYLLFLATKCDLTVQCYFQLVLTNSDQPIKNKSKNDQRKKSKSHSLFHSTVSELKYNIKASRANSIMKASAM